MTDRKPIGLSTPYRKVKKDKDGWVGLTPDERLIIIDQWHWDEGKPDYLCRLIESKLKEKNTK